MDTRHRQTLCLISTCYSGVRKIRPIPAIQHPLNVGNTLIQLGEYDPTLICASLLHDTIEDELLSEDDVRKVSNEVYSLVNEMTDLKELRQNRKLSWQQRKNNKLEKISKSNSKQMLLICASDISDNLNSLIADYDFIGDKVFEFLSAGKEKQHFYFETVGQILFQRSIELNHKNLKTLSLDILKKTHEFFR